MGIVDIILDKEFAAYHIRPETRRNVQVRRESIRTPAPFDPGFVGGHRQVPGISRPGKSAPLHRGSIFHGLLFARPGNQTRGSPVRPVVQGVPAWFRPECKRNHFAGIFRQIDIAFFPPVEFLHLAVVQKIP